MVNGSDTEFRRVLRGLAAAVRRLDIVLDLAARPAGLTGPELDFLLAVHEAAPARGEILTEPGVAMMALSRRLDVSVYYASVVSIRLVRRGLLAKWPDPANRRQRRRDLTAAGEAVADEAAPLIESANNLAFAVLRPRDFAALRRIAPRLEDGSAQAVDVLAQRTGDDAPRSIAALRHALKRLGGK